MVGILVFASLASGSRSQNQNNANPRGECEQACTRDYQTCRKAANANQTQCRQTTDDCKAGCKNPATPTPTEMPTATPVRWTRIVCVAISAIAYTSHSTGQYRLVSRLDQLM